MKNIASLALFGAVAVASIAAALWLEAEISAGRIAERQRVQTKPHRRSSSATVRGAAEANPLAARTPRPSFSVDWDWQDSNTVRPEPRGVAPGARSGEGWEAQR